MNDIFRLWQLASSHLIKAAPSSSQSSLPLSKKLYRIRRSINHLASNGLALFHGSVAARLQRASRLAARSFSLMLKSSSRGAIGRVASRTSVERFELAEDADAVLRALERRRGCGMELKRMMLL